ncbi:hypothetical protein BKA93DRAFT_743711 [Sparassis latifolia]|uniref:Oxysterol-binding protein-like protein n=1 Tax=Sparassis crispa TaxID=139825 RepID=A0A401GZ10_9APHY|nr:Oxysterol-binding protein-like protein [Sparassis crispa]GBE87394.1 Oxysterol-binding protein-like protein [Sparassis crispa]
MADHDDNVIPQDEDVSTQPIAVPDSADGESGKLKMILQLLKKCLGVKDIAAMRLSLPASLLEPIPNLEYWHYLDRPDLFAAINDSDDPFERMLAVLRFAFSKDIKFIRGRVVKPYNSVLGEHFRSHWDVIPVAYSSDPLQPPIQHLYLTPAAAESSYSTIAPTPKSETASIRSGKSGKSGMSTLSGLSALTSTSRGYSTPGKSTPGTSPSIGETDIDAAMSNLDLVDSSASSRTDLIEAGEAPAEAEHERVRVVFLTEQVSHHPPVSAFVARCPSRHIELRGVDQISAKVSGTALRIIPGSLNKGLFVKLTGGADAGETYHITHPVGAVNGMLRGSFYVTMGEATIITCSGGAEGKKLRAIIEYKEESWLGRAHFLVEGVVHEYSPGETQHLEWTRVKHVPQSCVVATFDGSWKHLIRWRRVDSTENATLIDLSTLHAIPMSVRPLEKQHPRESRKLWENVTSGLLKKEYSEATKHKLFIEQRQRDEAAERKRRGAKFIPQYFESDIDSGYPTLTAEGQKAVEEELEEEEGA